MPIFLEKEKLKQKTDLDNICLKTVWKCNENSPREGSKWSSNFLLKFSYLSSLSSNFWGDFFNFKLLCFCCQIFYFYLNLFPECSFSAHILWTEHLLLSENITDSCFVICFLLPDFQVAFSCLPWSLSFMFDSLLISWVFRIAQTPNPHNYNPCLLFHT